VSPGLLVRLAAVALLLWFVALPLRDVLAYPDRLSVLPNLQTDAETYHAIASDLAIRRDLAAVPSRHPPGWVSLLALVYGITGPSYVAGKILSWIALCGAVAACAWLAGRLHAPPAGWIAALLCASSPAMRGYVGTLQYEVITAVGLLALLVLAVRVTEAPTRRSVQSRAAVAGLAAAALIVTRETFAVVVPLIACWIVYRAAPGGTRRNAVVAAALLCATAIAPAIGWSAAQSIRTGALVMISEKGPMVVELGHNVLANGTYNAPLVGTAPPTGLAFVRQYPGRSMVLAGRKVLYFWGVLRDGWNVPRPSAVWLWRASTGIVPLDVFGAFARGGWLLAVFLVAIWSLGRDGLHRWWILPAVVLMLMAVHVVTLSSHRFAVPVLPVVFVLVSGPLAAALRYLGPALRSPAVVAASVALVSVALAMQFRQWPLALDYRAADLDGLSADNLVDPLIGTPVRFADSTRGIRPMVLLTDEYLPQGTIGLTVRARRTSHASPPDTAIARIALVDLDGRPACAREVSAAELPADRFAVISMDCDLPHDGPATLAVYSLGTADLAIANLHLRWIGRSASRQHLAGPP
jgi:4-amino-4-deoxy-L-arabinose transferase-like glycosyltransferase